MTRVGFIGLGNMGGGMTASLAKKGHDPGAFDLPPRRPPVPNPQGALSVASAAEALRLRKPSSPRSPYRHHVESVHAASVLGTAAQSATLINAPPSMPRRRSASPRPRRPRG